MIRTTSRLRTSDRSQLRRWVQRSSLAAAAALLIVSGCTTVVPTMPQSDGGTNSQQPDAEPPETGDCTVNIDCNDLNPCTDDICTAAGTCERVANSATCDDGNACTQNDTCVATQCTSGTNTCDCQSDADCAAFEDGDLCNGTLSCTAEHVCEVAAGTVVTCPTDADTTCSTNLCQPLSGACQIVNADDGTGCDDNDSCTTGETCRSGVCAGATETCCDDQINNDGDTETDCDDPDCVLEAVCEVQCTTIDDCAEFEDGNLCNGTLFCNAENTCALDATTVVTCPTTADTDCATNTCQPGTGTCQMVSTDDDTTCNDGDACTGSTTCQSGQCIGSELCCDDQINNDGDAQTDCDDPDCNGVGSCVVECTELEPVDPSPLPVQSPTNQTTTSGSVDYVYNQEGSRKLGTRRDWGGAIVFFGLANSNSSNVIDGNDTGREVQIAMYDHDRWYQGCAYNASCRSTTSTCDHTMTFFGWNPVQGGNRCNRGSGTEEVILENGTITNRALPLQWNPHWDRSDCNSDACGNSSVNTRRADIELVQKVKFIREDVVELSYHVTNLANIDHAAAAHEFPTVYASFGKDGTPDLYRLFDSSGNEITAGWNTDAHGFRYQNFTSNGGWASLQNAGADYGVALYYETGMSSFQAWNKLQEPTKFNNFRGLFSFALPAYGQVHARSYLILGAVGSVGAQVDWLSNNLAPFGSLDSPTAEQTISGNVSVYGWAMDNKAVSQVQMIIDGGAPTNLSYGSNRPDVCGVWPGYPACANNNVGFNGSINAAALAPNPCGHVIEINVIDNQGNAHIIARRRFYTGS